MLNILKLLLLIPFLLILCLFIGGQYWWIVMILALGAGYFWFKAEDAEKKKKIYLQQQVEITRQNMIQAQAEHQRAQQKADIREAVQDAKREQWFEGQWN